MTRHTRSGAVIPSHVGGGVGQSASGGLGVRRGYIKKVVFPDDRENLTGSLEYVVNIGGQDFYGCLDAVSMGGIFNNHIKVRKGQTPEMNPKAMLPFTTDDQKNGDAVWCLFIKDSHEHPLIIASANHPRSEENADYLKPSKSLGQMERYEFNGLEFLINKDGDFTLTQLGLKHPVLGKAAPPQTGYFKIDKTGNFEIKTTLGSIIQVLDTDNKISLRTPANDKVEISVTDGVQVEIATGAKASFKDAKVDIESPMDITVKSTTGNVTVEGVGGAKAKIGGGKVGIGSPAAEVLDTISKHLEEHDKDLDALIQAAPTFVSTSVGPGVLSPAVVTRLTTSKASLLALKTAIDAAKGGI